MASLYCTKFHDCSRLTSLSHLPPLFRVVLTMNSSILIDLSASLSASKTISLHRDWSLKLTETKDLQASVEPLLVGICNALGIHDGYDIEEHHQLDDNNHHHHHDPRDDVASNILRWMDKNRESRTFTSWHESLEFQSSHSSFLSSVYLKRTVD